MVDWNLLKKCISIMIFLFLWEIFAKVVNSPLLFPWPSYVLRVSLPSIAYFSGAEFPSYILAFNTVLQHFLLTVSRLFAGLAMGVALGVIMAGGMHYFSSVRFGSNILLVIIRSFPLFSLIPLFMFWFSGNDLSSVLYITFAVFVVMATAVYEAIYNIPEIYVRQSILLGASRLQVFCTVSIPAVFPEVFGAIRNIVGLSWAFSLGAEYLTGQDGLGYLVYLSYLYSDMGKLLVFAMLYGFLGFISYQILNGIAYYSKRWTY